MQSIALFSVLLVVIIVVVRNSYDNMGFTDLSNKIVMNAGENAKILSGVSEKCTQNVLGNFEQNRVSNESFKTIIDMLKILTHMINNISGYTKR